MVSQRDEPTIFVIDDDPAASASVAGLLRAEGLQSRSFKSAPEFLATHCRNARGCVISDLRLPEMDGVQLIQALKAQGSLLPVVLVSDDADVERAVDAMKTGARDLLEKPVHTERLLRAVRACLEENAAAAEALEARNFVQRRLESLTARERQVLQLIMDGASNKVIAQNLTISPRTVEIYRANVMAKMRADSLSELVRMTLAAGPG